MARLLIEITGKIRFALSVLSALWEQGPAVARLVTGKLSTSLEDGEEPPRSASVPTSSRIPPRTSAHGRPLTRPPARSAGPDPPAGR